VLADGVENIQMECNNIAFDNSIIASAKRFLKTIKAGEEILPIKVINCKNQNIKNNQVKK
jgi:hypothetical protein